jgi:hypothetical protein
MIYRLLDFVLWFSGKLDDVSYWMKQKALYNRWTTCPHCLIENGYGHKFDCPRAKGDGDDYG